MRFPELDPYKREAPELADSLSHLEAYLEEVMSRPVRHQGLDQAAFDIVPRLVAKELGIDEGLALVLLRKFDQAGIIVPRYHLYCPNTGGFIGAFDSVDDLPERIDCPFEDRTAHT